MAAAELCCLPRRYPFGMQFRSFGGWLFMGAVIRPTFTTVFSPVLAVCRQDRGLFIAAFEIFFEKIAYFFQFPLGNLEKNEYNKV